MASKRKSKVKAPGAIDLRVAMRVKAARREARISQVAMGEALGVTFQQVQKYERGDNRISAERLRKISKLVNKPLWHFFSDGDAPDTDEILSSVAEWMDSSPAARRVLAQLPKLNGRDTEVVAALLDSLTSRG